MTSVKFECETVTPMFLAGADGRNPELRAPSFKGMLRFWWRALNADLNPEELRQREAAIFGGVGEGQGKSKVIVRFLDLKNNQDNIRISPLPHKENSFKLLAFPPGTTFSLLLRVPRETIVYKEKEIFNIEKIRAMVILSFLLGGLGKRTRRGFGSIRIVRIDNQNYNMPETLQEIYSLFEIIKKDYFEIENNIIISKFDKRSKYGFIKEIQIGNPCNPSDFLLEKISKEAGKYFDPCLGYANNHERLASPIYVTTIKTNDQKYRLLITTLNTVFPHGKSFDLSKQSDFKGAIL